VSLAARLSREARRDAGAREGDRRADRRREGRRPAAGADGVRPARARRSIDHRRRTVAEDAVDHERENQVPRIVPAVRAGGAAGARRRVVRAGRRQPVHAAGRGRPAVAPAARGRRVARAVGHRAPERPAVDHPGRHARRLLGADPAGAARDEPAVLRHHRCLQSPHRLSGDRQHVVQRARRADRLHAGGRLPLLHAHEHGRAGARELHPRQDRAGRRRRGRVVEEGVRARLTDVLVDHAERISPAAYWELLMNLTKREVKGRYSQSVFGIGWAIAQPLATMAVVTILFARLAKMRSGGAPYPVFAYAALVPWFFFSNSVASGTLSLVTYRNIVTKTYFPREIVPLAQVCSRLIDFCAAAALFGLMLAYYRVPLGPWALMAPVFFLLLVLFTVGLTLATSAVNVFFRDVNPVVQ